MSTTRFYSIVDGTEIVALVSAVSASHAQRRYIEHTGITAQLASPAQCIEAMGNGCLVLKDESTTPEPTATMQREFAGGD